MATLKHRRNNNYASIDATPEAEQEWRKHVNEIANKSLFPQAESWYFGRNVPGKHKEALNYMNGLVEYRKRIWGCAEEEYSGFTLTKATAAWRREGLMSE